MSRALWAYAFAFSVFTVFVQSYRTSVARRAISMAASEKESSFWDLLNGNAAIRKAKAANPALYQRAGEKRPAKTSRKIEITPIIQASVDLYKKENPQSEKFTDQDLASAFKSLSEAFKSENDAVQVVKNYPDVLGINPSKFNDILGTFEKKWGFEKAKGVLIRNPSLFNVPVSGYGSAEAAAEETIYMSYVIAATRPFGKPLLFTLFVLLLKPFYGPLIGLE